MNITLPSGLTVDFSGASQEEIEDALEAMREQDPSLFEEASRPPETIDELIASKRNLAREESDEVSDIAPRLRDRLPILVFAMSLVKETPLKNKKSS